MRILQIRLKNLNSLVGEWEVDLTHQDFTSDGIFAITGPTGAGKSTILDAICLALYGRTPRLNKVTKSLNEIMSRQTGECFSEVTFETQAGLFRCHWSQHKARKNPTGELQAPKHEIADATSGKIIETKIRRVAEKIEDATGMDFDRFTRSMLLAQGGFSAFLKADPGERAPILEQITGTEIYSLISTRVHERRREERDKLDILQVETAGIVILEPEQEIEIQQALDTKQKEETDLNSKLADTGKAITWLTAIDGLKKEIASLADEASELQSAIEAFKPERDKLSRAVSAASLDGSYGTLTAIRKEQAGDQAALKSEEETLPELEFSAKEQAESFKMAEQQLFKAKAELQAAAPILQKVRSFDQKLADQKKAVSEVEETCQKDLAKIDADKQAWLKEREKHSKAQKKLRGIDRYFEENAKDEWLISGLAGVEEQLNILLDKQKEIIQKKDDREKAVKVLEQAMKSLGDRQKQCGTLRQELEKVTKNLQQGKDALRQLLAGRLLREYRTEMETLLREMTLLAKIAELEDHRAKLEDGKPCPLCGATEHPFAEGNVPTPDETEKQIESLKKLISKAEDQDGAVKKLEESEVAAQRNLTDGEKQEALAANDKKAAEKALADVKEGLEKLQIDFDERRQTALAKLLPLGIKEIPDGDISSLLESLRARMNEWKSKVKKKTEIEKKIADLDSEVKSLGAVIETQQIALAEKKESLETLQKELVDGTDERKELYGDKNPDVEERRLNKAISEADYAEKKARDLHSELQKKWDNAKTNVESLKKRIAQREPDLKKSETEFSAALEPVGFSDEEQFLKARLTAEHRDELGAKAKKLDDSQTVLNARQKDRETRLAEEIARKVTDKSLEELEPILKEYEDSLIELRDSMASLKHKLSENTAAKERVKAKQAAIDGQKKECRRWDNLHQLIGSNDGKKYRNFAQGLTFELMVGHANLQLQKMSDRYLLIRDDEQPLELNVVDNYQAGEIRSTKNLSGGESFIVSLSLALGLSQMASKNVRVDSLFLDEGFGTLDEEALDTALETLAGLQQEGKIIGLISHVPALKERISTRIAVTPQTGGRGLITGPGCRKL